MCLADSRATSIERELKGFEAQASRAEFWFGVMCVLMFGFLLVCALLAYGEADDKWMMVIGGISLLFLFIGVFHIGSSWKLFSRS
jgi:uncharacterized membrane protein YhaH (DUF805 family)